MNFRVIRILIGWAFSLCGCIFQVYHISDVYFDYETVTQLTIKHPSRVIPPKVAICFDREKSEGLSTNLDSHIQRIRINWPTIYGHSGWTNTSKRYVTNYTTTKFFYKRDKRCFSVRLTKKVVFQTGYITRTIQAPRFFSFYLLGDHLRTARVILLYLKPYHLDFYGPFDSFAEVDRSFDPPSSTSGKGDNNFVTLTYSTFKSTLMAYPYKTNCINYSARGYESQDHCFDKCVLDRFVAKQHKRPFSVLSRNTSIPGLDYLKDRKEVEILKQVETSCSKLCKRPDCVIANHVPRVMMMSPTEGDRIGFELYVSVDSNITTEFKPLLKFVDFATFVLSCIGFWLGFSPLVFISKFEFNKRAKTVGDSGLYKPNKQKLFVQGSLSDQVRLLEIKGHGRDREIRELRQFCKEMMYRIDCRP